MIKFRCKKCGQKISVPEIHAGKKGKCPKCKNIVVVPKVEEAESVAGQAKPSVSEIGSKGSILDPNLFDIPMGHPTAQGSVSNESLEGLQKLQEGLGIRKVEPVPVPERKLPWLIDIFLYPTNKSGLTMLGIFVGVPLFMEVFVRVLNLLAMRFPPFHVFAVFFLIISLIINIIIRLYRYWYLSKCVQDSADGQIRAPDTVATTPGLGEMLSLFLKIFVCIIIFSAPIYYYLLDAKGIDRSFWSLFNFILFFWWIVVSEVGRSGITFHLLLFFAVFFFPMTILSVVMFDSFRGLNPLLIVGSIFSTFAPYCGLILMLCILWVPVISMRKFIIAEAVSGRPGLFLYLPRAVSVYLMLVGAHLLGRFAWNYKDKLNWGL